MIPESLLLSEWELFGGEENPRLKVSPPYSRLLVSHVT